MSLIDFIAAKPGFCLFWAGLALVTAAYIAFIIGWEIGAYRSEKRILEADFDAAMREANGKEGGR